MSDPQPVINWYRALTFISLVASLLLKVDTVSVDVKQYLVIGLIVISGALTVFFDTGSTNPSIAKRIVGRFQKPAA